VTRIQPTRILILGGGFGGLYAALELERTLARGCEVEVTLVCRDNFHLFTPMLHEVAASDLDLTHIVNPIRKLLRRVRLFVGEVERIDLASRRVSVSHSHEHHHHELLYDHLVLALGSVTNLAGLPGLGSTALTMRTLGDAIRLRNHVIENLETADFECSADARQPLLTVVVAGAGFAGVETLAAVHDFVHEALRFYPRLRKGDIRMVLVDPASGVLPELGEGLGGYARRKLEERGIEVRLGIGVTAVKDGLVNLSDGTAIPTRTLVWTAGNAPNPLVAGLPLALERGRIVVDGCLRVPEWPGVWAIGDGALVPDPRGGHYPPTAQHALRQGSLVARNIARTLRREDLRPFRFSTLGQLAAIGRRTGVARVLGLQFSGFAAWWLWRTIYLSKLPRLEKKLRVLLDWSLDLVFSKDIVQFATRPSGATPHPENPPRPVLAAGDRSPEGALRLPVGEPSGPPKHSQPSIARS
jgi:NADH:quinone reductase (non-electrogenic)